jgi:hypothetical protein
MMMMQAAESRLPQKPAGAHATTAATHRAIEAGGNPPASGCTAGSLITCWFRW